LWKSPTLESQVCEHLLRHAWVADRFTLIRSCRHDQANHVESHARFLSGYGQMKTGPSHPRRLRLDRGASGQRRPQRRGATGQQTPRHLRPGEGISTGAAQQT
jgi:hypothetical protein